MAPTAGVHGPAPDRLSFAVGGFGGPDRRVEWRDGVLRVESDEGGCSPPRGRTRTAVVPSQEQWMAFRQACDRIGVWAWRRCYDAPVLDGEQWHLELAWGGRTCTSFGSNAYPGARGQPVELRRTKAFREFQAALEILAAPGGPPASGV